jgi:regulator of protease activity HflC (stomatin/prohibitin superfamily)
MIYIAIFILVVGVALWAMSPKQGDGRIMKPIGQAVTAAAIVVALIACIKVVPAGHVSVASLFGKVSDTELEEGFHVVNPLMAFNNMSVRTDTSNMRADETGQGGVTALTKDGLRVTLDVTVAYKLVGSDASFVYRNYGLSYNDTLIVAPVRTAIREVASRYTSTELYGPKREEAGNAMGEQLAIRIASLIGNYEDFNGTGMLVQEVLLRDVKLPPVVTNAIEAKLAEEQRSEAMFFTLERERQEAERKRIEAEGIRDFQTTVREGIDDELLLWRGIEATAALAESDNAKVVVIGSPGNGLPLVLGDLMSQLEE